MTKRECIELIKNLYSEKGRLVVGIDGRSAAGKTTFANELKNFLGADVVHTDHFFLPFPLRTEERLAEAGGNIHYERFYEEVVIPLKLKKSFSYGIFDCSSGTIKEKSEEISSELIIVEGAYSHHPKWREIFDVLIFMDIDPDEQIARIKKRNGEQKAEIFKNVWIVLEERYIQAFGINNSAVILSECRQFN